jgi:prepilin-type N-terminal cleavage/methylation domain-containing protein
MRKDYTSGNPKGFTLIELLVAMTIMLIVIGAIYSMFASVNRSYANNEVTAEVMQNTRAIIAFLEQDIRMAGLDRFDSAGAGIEAATATNIRFTSDRNINGTIDDADVSDGVQEVDFERITYFYDAPNNRLRQCLSEGTTNAWETLIENVDDFQFEYLDADNNPIPFPVADLASIRTVVISITIERPAAYSESVSRTLTKQVFCRNLGM